jgi:hypothetical protein
MNGTGWAALIGGFLLAAVMLWAVIRNRQTSARLKERSERGAQDLYDSIGRQEQRQEQQQDAARARDAAGQ